MVNDCNRVHTKRKTSGITVSTLPNLKKILREAANKPTVLRGILSTALRNVGTEVLPELVVAYYNGVEVEPFKRDGTATAVTRELGTDCFSFNGLERLAVLLLEMTGSFRLNLETIDPDDAADPQNKTIRKATKELQKSQSEFRAAVKWLCSHKDLKPGATPDQLRRLHQSGKLGWGHFGRYPLIDKTSEDFIRYFEDHGLKHFKINPALDGGQYNLPVRLVLRPQCVHFVDLFCTFLLNECSGKTLAEMPFKVCRKCDRLFSPQRMEAEFCSNDCRRKNFWSPEKHRDYTYVCRLETFAKKCFSNKYGYSKADLHEKLESSDVRIRLREIEAVWQSWPKLTEKLNAIRAR
jgi:hypothetical protein